MTLASLGIIDWRAKLPRANWIIGRRPATTSVTLHYNGPPLAQRSQWGIGLLAQLRADAHYQMRPGWGGTRNGSPGLMYHFVVAADGTIYQTRDIDEILWHCAHQDGNTRGWAVHFPLGGSQDAGPLQWARGLELIEELRALYAIPVSRVVGHLEWKHATACPGRLQPRVEAYRAGLDPFITPTPTPPGVHRFRVLYTLATSALVRQGPGRTFGIAGRLKPGTLIYVDPPADASQAIDGIYHKGEKVNGDPRWIHLARIANEQADLGFISATLVQELP